MRFAGRFMSLRWYCVRRHSSLQPLRLQQGLITAQGGTLMRVTRAITPGGTTVIVIIGTSRARRAGMPAWRKCRPRGLADSNASAPSSAAPGGMATSGGFGSSGVVAEARRYIGGNPTGRGSQWCARFMNFVLQRSGHHGTGSDMARSFASYGQRVSGPQIGAIAVMGRRGGGHVGVVSGIDAGGNPILVSGNNRNRVVEAPVSRGRIYAYVMPTG